MALCFTQKGALGALLFTTRRLAILSFSNLVPRVHSLYWSYYVRRGLVRLTHVIVHHTKTCVWRILCVTCRFCFRINILDFSNQIDGFFVRFHTLFMRFKLQIHLCYVHLNHILLRTLQTQSNTYICLYFTSMFWLQYCCSQRSLCSKN